MVKIAHPSVASTTPVITQQPNAYVPQSVNSSYFGNSQLQPCNSTPVPGAYMSHKVSLCQPPTAQDFYKNQIQHHPAQVSAHLTSPPVPPPSYQHPKQQSSEHTLTQALEALPPVETQAETPENGSENYSPSPGLEAEILVAENGGGDSTSRPGSSSNIKMLKTKQTVMEHVMKKLLHSLKEIKDHNGQKSKEDAETERRLKVTRMMQLLMLQRQNLQMQIENITESFNTLQAKHQALKHHSEGCVTENLELNKKFRKLLAEKENKDTQIKALMQLSCKLQRKLESHNDTEIALENTSYELKRLATDNENLKAANNQLEACFTEKVKERESTVLQNSQLTQDLERIQLELANQRVRTEKVSAENSNLRNQLALSEAGNKSVAKRNSEYEQLREAYENLLFDHQRLQMLYISETETRRDLHNQLQEVSGNIRVISRFRPRQEQDDSSPFEFCAMDKIFVPGRSNPSTVSYRKQLGIQQPAAYVARDECYAFSRVFQSNAKQEDIFEEIRPLIGSYVDGFNVCILAYGPTGSGKTYTMQGTKKNPGICSRSVTELFDLCEPLQGVWTTEVNVAMFEIHNEVIYDLLATQITPVRLSDNGSDVRLINAEEKVTRCEQETLHWIELGYMRRKVSSTKLNVESSRSHLIIRMHLCLTNTIDNQRRTSSLVLCDLAGSESAERIDASNSQHVETGYINRSLVTLARVFETLRRKSGHASTSGLAVPYRDSKLTHLLKPCLGGHAKCVLIVAASPEKSHLDRTLKALEFAQRAMQVSLGRPSKNSRILVSSHVARV